MDKFEASNGAQIVLTNARQTGYVLVEKDDDVASAYLGFEEMVAWREFFRAERDEELDRWRYPKDPQFVVYPGFSPGEDSRVARVVHEHVGTSTLVYEKPGIGRTSHPAATAYFEAHPERKPWHDAKPGEVWVVTEGDLSETYPYLVDDEQFYDSARDYALNFNDPAITAARRIWPELSGE